MQWPFATLIKKNIYISTSLSSKSIYTLTVLLVITASLNSLLSISSNPIIEKLFPKEKKSILIIIFRMFRILSFYPPAGPCSFGISFH